MDNEVIGTLNNLDRWREMNPFNGVDFSILYSWLPGDISGACAGIVAFLLVLAIIGIVKKFLLR